MKKESVLHIPMSQYAHGMDETTLVFRLRVAKNDLLSCTLNYGDTACRSTPIVFHEVEMKTVATDAFFDYYEVVIESLYHRVYYYFTLFDGHERIYYYSDFFRNELVDDRSEYYKIPFNHRADIVKIPSWVNDAIIYNIFPDSFATGHRYISGVPLKKEFHGKWCHSRLGGTIKGIEENVDYLVDLGINCIYINPIFVAGEYHKYDTIDYFNVDPCFGTNEDFKSMVKTYHQKGIKVIIDGVFNHSGWNFPAFEDVVDKGMASKYTDWFYRLEYPVIKSDDQDAIPNYECFAYERLMPKLDTSNSDTAKYLLEVAKFWIETFDIDGWRLDVASEVDDQFWRSFRNEVKKIKPDAFIIGEVWENAQHWLDGSMYDSTMNYDLRKHCKYFFAEGSISSDVFDACVTNMRMRYKKNFLWGQLNLLDSHDVSRFLSLCDGDLRRYKLAVIFQMMYIGVPSIYYGDEQMIMGIQELDYRKPMEWCMDNELYVFYKKIIDIRKTYKAITHGDYNTLGILKHSKGYAFERYYKNQRIQVFLNASADEIALASSDLSGTIILAHEWHEKTLGAFGYVICAECI